MPVRRVHRPEAAPLLESTDLRGHVDHRSPGSVHAVRPDLLLGPRCVASDRRPKPVVANHVVIGSVVITPEPAIASLTVGSPIVVIGHSRPVDCANPLSCGPQLPTIPEDMMTSPTMASSISVLSS